MPTQKLYAGAKLRETRTRLGLTQRAFAERLGVSLPYLNQMENNARPLSAAVVLGLAREFGLDVTELSAGDADRLVSDLAEALADPVLRGAPVTADLRLVAANAPGLARAVLDLHRAYRQATERLAALDEALGRQGADARPSPWEEVRDFFHYCNNYIDAVDRAAERMATLAPGGDAAAAAEAALDAGGATLALSDDLALRSWDAGARRLTLSARAPSSTRRFQLLHHHALTVQAPLIDATLDLARFSTPEAREIARAGMANYFAGAALLPYARFQDAAEATGHDLERLADLFGASIEQVAHRLSTLQRPGAKGIPFFFVRVDQAGTITKRHSAARLQFARFGGACPLWNVHRAFETPGRFLRQLAETPDGVRYFCLARDVTKPAGSFDAPVRRFAIGLGCEIAHADRLVYARGLPLADPAAFEPIGISCRICQRPDCHQRSVPPLESRLTVDHARRGVLPYRVAGG
jgi:predicted transcriptional regulator/DNA-binding XRE family transcriptional regulator